MENLGKIYMVPMNLGEVNSGMFLPPEVLNIIKSLKFFIAENAKTTRHYLISLGMKDLLNKITIFQMDKHADKVDYSDFFKESVLSGFDLGVISEAGCPGVADPGSEVVRQAHLRDIRVVPLVGPSSILLSLMASGLNGQSFAFNGYLPVKMPERLKTLKKLEELSKQKNQTQIFIETPYRNNSLLDFVCNNLSQETLLTIACQLTLPDEFIKTQSIKDWKKQKYDFDKKPSIFLILKK